MKQRITVPGTPVKRRPSNSSACLSSSSEIVRKIAEGSFYKIYLTRNNTALRVSKKPNPGELEAEIMQKVDCLYINKMLRWWTCDGYAYFEMEYCPAGSLAELIERDLPNPNTAKDGVRNEDAIVANTSNREKCVSDRKSTAMIDSMADPTAMNSTAMIDSMADPTAMIPSTVNPTAMIDSMADPFTDSVIRLNTSVICTDSDSDSLTALQHSSPLDSDPQPGPGDTQPWIKRMMAQISKALVLLHANNIIHMDIKPDNILIDGEDFKLCDFNISRFGEGLVDLDGDPIYMAPEILRNKCYFTSDVFSLGLIYLRLCNPGSTLPNGGEAYSRIRRNDFAGWQLDQIGRWMLEKNPHKRCSAHTVTEYFEKYIGHIS